VAVSVLIWGGIHVYDDLYPPDRIGVRILGIPPATRFISILVERDGCAHGLAWSPSVSGVAIGPMDPASCIWSHRNLDDPSELQAFVFWQPGIRYGVIRFEPSHGWWVTWFSKVDVPVSRQDWLQGDFGFVLNLASGRTERPQDHLVGQLGLDEVRDLR
jgi:hypothetical protein